MKNLNYSKQVKIDFADSSQIAEVKLSYATKVKSSDRPLISSSSFAAELFKNSWDTNTIEHVETMKLMLLSRANRVLGITTLSTGGTSGCVVDVKTVFQYALLSHASAIIMAHNHPSGNKQPSESDKLITRKVKEAGKVMDIQLLDHLIITPYESYYSMGDNGDL